MAISLSSFENVELIKNLSGFEPNAKLTFDKNDIEVVIDRQDNAKSVATLKPSDSETNGFVCFRRDNKIGVKCHVSPSGDISRVRCVFNLRCILSIKDNTPIQTPSASNMSMSSPSSPGPSVSSPTLTAPSISTIPMTYQIFVDFGPSKVGEELQVVQKPQYVDDCFILTNK
jgi:hypothetical protein